MNENIQSQSPTQPPIENRINKIYVVIGAVTLVLLIAVGGFVLWNKSRTFTNPVATELTNSEQRVPIYIAGRNNFPTGYEKDSSHVYWLDGIVSGADPSSFKVFDMINQPYGEDNHNVYFGTTTVVGADLKTFNAFDLFATDTDAVYRMGEVIPGADPKTFVDLNENYSKDAQNVYYQNSVLVGADPKTIEIISDYEYAKDTNHVYDWGKVMPGVDPKTFISPPPG